MAEQRSLKSIVIALSFITAGLLVGVAVIGWLLVQKQNELARVDQNSAQKRQAELLAQQYRDILERTQDERQKLQTYTVRGDAGTVTLLETLERRAQEESVTLVNNITVQKNTNNKEVLAIALEARGDFERVMAFLESLQNLPHETTFEEISLKRSSEIAGQSATWTLSGKVFIISFIP